MGNAFSSDGSVPLLVEKYLPHVQPISPSPLHSPVPISSRSISWTAECDEFIEEMMDDPVAAIQAELAGFGTLKWVDGKSGQTKSLATRTGASGITVIFDELNLGDERKEVALRIAETGDFAGVASIILEAANKKIAENATILSTQDGGCHCLKSVHGSYLRAIEAYHDVDLVQRRPTEREYWHIAGCDGKVVLRSSGALNKKGQFLRAQMCGTVDLTDASPPPNGKDANRADPAPLEVWKPFKNDDGSWSLLSLHGTWLSASVDGSVSTVVRCGKDEHFWIESW